MSSVPASFDRAGLEDCGFLGFERASSLRTTRCREIPNEPGVYAVLTPEGYEQKFRSRSAGGWFKGKDPTVTVDLLRLKWVAGTPVVYIGMAGRSLRRRVRALVDYGGGKPVGHQGGRYLWQLEGCDELLVAWLLDPEPARTEDRLLAAFQVLHRGLPFANLRT